MKRRKFLQLTCGMAVAWPAVARAQKSPALIGYLSAGAATSALSAIQIATVRQGLRDNGLIEGRDYVLHSQFSNGDYARFPEMARDLAERGARVLLVATIAAAFAAQKVTPAVPVVMLAINDPVGVGLVASLAHPGGHTTGMASLNEDLTPKLLEIQREIVPSTKVIAAIFNPANPSNLSYVKNLQAVAGNVGIAVQPVELMSPNALDAAFSTIDSQDAVALHIVADSAVWDLSDRIAALALARRLPSFTTLPKYAKLGGLIDYGAFPFLRACSFVKRILDGVKPGDLPVEQPTRIDLTINLNTANALGLTMPPTLLARADEVIE